MSQLTLTVIRLVFLVLLWLFVFSAVGVMRSDLYGARTSKRQAAKQARAMAARATQATVPGVRPQPHPVAAGQPAQRPGGPPPPSRLGGGGGSPSRPPPDTTPGGQVTPAA